MRGVALTDLHGKPITPGGCAAPGCGVPSREHPQLFTPQARWHYYEQPGPQLIAQRARALRRLRDQQIVTDAERRQADADAAAFARWLHDGEPYGKAAR